MHCIITVLWGTCTVHYLKGGHSVRSVVLNVCAVYTPWASFGCGAVLNNCAVPSDETRLSSPTTCSVAQPHKAPSPAPLLDSSLYNYEPCVVIFLPLATLPFVAYHCISCFSVTSQYQDSECTNSTKIQQGIHPRPQSQCFL